MEFLHLILSWPFGYIYYYVCIVLSGLQLQLLWCFIPVDLQDVKQNHIALALLCIRFLCMHVLL